MEKRRYKILLGFLLLLCMLGCMTGCGQKDEGDQQESLEAGEYRIYYVNSENNKLTSMVYQASGKDTEALIGELMEKINQNPEKTEWKTAKPEGVEVRGHSLENKILTIYFNGAYQSADSVKEILYRAAVVKTMVQIDGISGVQFMVNDQPLMDSTKTAVGVMRAETFLEDSGGQVSKEQTATLVLYFTNKEGTELISTEQRVRYSTNYSLEKAVVTQLLRGPSEDGLYPTLPSNANLLGISVKDGVCYVDFDKTFIDDALNVAGYVPIYSLVNSLAELATVNRVQITINGSSDYTFRGSYPLNQTYERKMDFKEGE